MDANGAQRAISQEVSVMDALDFFLYMGLCVGAIGLLLSYYGYRRGWMNTK